jgi:hypothetical protein
MTQSGGAVTRYVARDDIPFGGVLAYTRGQRVDAAAVEAHPEWKDLVVGEGTKEARQILAEITGETPADSADRTAGRRAAATAESQEG